MEQERRVRLGPRLAMCASFVRPGSLLADVGTDHGYLPVALLQAGTVPRCVASDIREGPLGSARRNAEKYGVSDKIRFLLSDGLSGFSADDADDIVIAGMGGELILRIVAETAWLRDPEKRLILQPMTMAPALRAGLLSLGFSVEQEAAASEGEKVYTVLLASYTGETRSCTPLFAQMGALEPGRPETAQYARRVCRDLENRVRGIRCQNGDAGDAEALLREIQEIHLPVRKCAPEN